MQLIDKFPICLKSFIKPAILIDCSHIFCKLCIKKWIQSRDNCPISPDKIINMQIYLN